MANRRALSFPLSHRDQTLRSPPFQVGENDAAILRSCEGFRCIRSVLKCQQNNIFCASHKESARTHKEAWLLQRDITFALVYPLLEIYRQAHDIAMSVLGDGDLEDIELVFNGEQAQTAFAWLKYFILEEEDWCLAEGCPACNVCYVLQSEPTILMILTACRLAQSLRRYSGQQKIVPIFDFWLATLREALEDDPNWPTDCWRTVEPKASSLERGIFAMASQCCRMSNDLSNPETNMSLTPPDSSNGQRPSSSRQGSSKKATTQGKTKGAFISKESGWMQNIVIGCWTTLIADAKHHATNETSRSPRPMFMI